MTMKILIIGGTIFLGRHLVAAAGERGHAVRLFNRGKSNPGLFPKAVTIFGDRDGGLADALGDASFDCVIDTCGYVPRIVRQSVDHFQNLVGSYVFVSSVSVYGDLSQPGISEEAPCGVLEDETVEDIEGGNYGPLKALCEKVLLDAMPGKALIVRPGLIVGPHDPTDRFTYWPVRIKGGGAIIAPGDRNQPVQFIDARDLAAWIIRAVEEGLTGVFNATGPSEPLSAGELFETAREATGSDASFHWLEREILEKESVAPWSDMPLWIPPGHEAFGINSVDSSRARSRGLVTRPVSRTIADTVAWFESEREPDSLKAGLSKEREREILSAAGRTFPKS
ncbi:MAG: NAD-dependent epimerase/dehydratase family protein [Candidatus Obscuribacterales bacterium]